MTESRYIFFFFFNFFFQACLWGQNHNLQALQSEVFLHPADAFTAYTLQRGEMVYNQPPFVLPLPGWAMYGLTSDVTVEIDLLPLVGGLFQKPHLPVPSINIRWALMAQKHFRPAIALETMYQHLWNPVTQSQKPFIQRKGNSWFGRLNFSWKLSDKLHTHFSAGVTYTENLYMLNSDTVNPIEKHIYSTFTPDVSGSIDYRPKPWISLHASLSYGTTFVYLDNIPLKRQISYGFRVAPFYKSRKSFFRHFRMEFIGFYMYFPAIRESISSLLPVFPYLYWQWNFRNKKSRRKAG